MNRSELLPRITRRLRVSVGHGVKHALQHRRNRGRSFTPILVTGAMGSGTTLLALELAQRFQVAGFVDEAPFHLSRRSFLRTRRIAGFDSVAAYEQSLIPRENWTVEPAREAHQRLYRERVAGAGDLVVDKAANVYMARASLYASCFPDSQILMIFRDPVANVEGFRRKWPTFAGEALEASIGFYQRLHERFLEQAIPLGHRVTLICYESLVEHNALLLRGLGERLGLRERTQLMSLESRPDRPGQGVRGVRSDRIEIARDANEYSYRGLSEPEVAQIRRALEPLHERLKVIALKPERPDRETE